MTDLVLLLVTAGRGGDGRVSFLRAKYKPKGGPDGGIGGDGGDVILHLDPHLASLSHLAGVREITAEAGQRGGPKSQRGHAAAPVKIAVPAGTHIFEVVSNDQAKKRLQTAGVHTVLPRSALRRQQFSLEYPGGPYPERPEDDTSVQPEIYEETSQQNLRPKDHDWQLLCVIDEETPEVVICQGGIGGRGNESFKTSTNRTPLQAERGSFGEERLLVFELKLLADVGLVGLPNAGKSTLLSVLTKAKPKIGAYPFTTLEPHLGIFQSPGGKELVIADIPGLIEGASQGKGLGHDFLRHVEHCEGLVYVVAPEEVDLVEAREDGAELARRMARQLALIQSETAQYDQALAQKRSVVVLNKVDLLPPEVVKTVLTALSAAVSQLSGQTAAISVLGISGATLEGIPHLSQQLEKLKSK